MNRDRKSFTLIELLVVLALVAILSVVVVMTLNPAELLKQARDSNRLSDLATVNTSLNLFSSDVVNGFMGTSSIVYVSIPDNASSTCGSLGLPTLPTGWVYNCVTSQNLRKTDGTGWIPVNFQRISSNSPISQLPIDPINTTTTNSYYTYIAGGSWKLTAISLESAKYIAQGNTDGGTAPSSFEMGNDMSLGQTVFPNNWIKVPGNSTFGTSDFWVMKYEAKCADTSGNLLITPTESTYQTYQNNYDAAAACIALNNKYITSAPSGYPIARIAQSTAGANNDAIEYCQSIGAHLITNNEWQTIAWDIQNNAINWSGGAVGSGYVYSGHNDNSPASALIASSNDNNGYVNTGNSSGNQKRTHVLSNGQTIWDLAGNLWEWNSDTILGTNKPIGIDGSWVEWAAVSNFGTLTQQAVAPANSNWGSAQGIGKYYQGVADGSVYGFVRGGLWNAISNAGLETFYPLIGPASMSGYIGFRCVR